MSHKSQISIKIPGKTFLMGEYLALDGGPSLVASTEPFFEVIFSVQDEVDKESLQGVRNPFHPASPAGLWVSQNIEKFKNTHIDWTDGYGGMGGFGASTAQFIAVWLFCQEEPQMPLSPGTIRRAWQDYEDCFLDDVKPSGADVINQMFGGLTLWSAKTSTLDQFPWPFFDLKVDLYKTKIKTKTHEHLNSLNSQDLPLRELRSSMEEALRGLETKNSDAFLIQSIEYSKILQSAGLQDKSSLELIDQILESGDVLHARGCGALGSDVIAVYMANSIDLNFEHLGLKKIASLPQNLNTETCKVTFDTKVTGLGTL